MEVVPAAKPQKRPLGDENAAGDDDAQDASKKQRSEEPPAAAAEATKLTAEQTKLASQWQERKKNAKGGDVGVFALEPKNSEVKAVEYVTRLLDMTKEKGKYHINSLAVALQPSYKQFTKKRQLTKIKNALGDLSTVAFLAASAPTETEEEEGHVDGSIDVKLIKGDDVWRRYRDTTAAGEGTPGVSRQQIERALEKQSSDPADPYARQRGFEVRDVTDAVRCATATNKVVRGYHRERIAQADRNYTSAKDRAKAEVDSKKEEEEAKVALAAAAKEQDMAYRKGQYDYFGMTYSSVPPLPDGATDADRERLQREALEAFYGLSTSPS